MKQRSSEVVQYNLHSEAVSMYIEQWTYYSRREQSVCKNVHSEVVQNNLHPEETDYVHRVVIGKENNQCVTMLIMR